MQKKLDRLNASITIRLLDTVKDMAMIYDLEKVVWGSNDPVPVHQTITSVKNGGIVIGAFLDDKLVGFQYSFPGFDGSTVYLCSHTLGVHPDYRIGGIGEKLKRMQREEAIRKGYDLITWTYDPLETVNAYLNIKKLGAVCSIYLENCYGEMTDSFNSGLPTDRFRVDWRITSQHVENALCADRSSKEIISGPKLIHVDVNDDGFPVPTECNWSVVESVNTLYVPVPAYFQRIKELEMNTALIWRSKTREAFTHCFQSGWQVVDFIKSKASRPNDLALIHYYVLKK